MIFLVRGARGSRVVVYGGTNALFLFFSHSIPLHPLARLCPQQCGRTRSIGSNFAPPPFSADVIRQCDTIYSCVQWWLRWLILVDSPLRPLKAFLLHFPFRVSPLLRVCFIGDIYMLLLSSLYTRRKHFSRLGSTDLYKSSLRWHDGGWENKNALPSTRCALHRNRVAHAMQIS